ncbi:MAG: hypothetical protein NZ518_11590 [Dehalococcoidia bacterium]|nr:hypothetical protein [Dehalococcoidia bacterium]
MRLAAVFTGMALAFLGAGLGCVVLAYVAPDNVSLFYAIVGAVVCFALSVGTAVAGYVGAHER